jgi:hypothetical protein
MRLYAGQAMEFIRLNKRNQLAGHMEQVFLERLGRTPSFEFDYAGIIIGKDMVYDFGTNAWKDQPEYCHDGRVKGSKKFLELIKNTYRVLLTRGQKGCYVYFMDKDSENYFRSRTRRSAQPDGIVE